MTCPRCATQNPQDAAYCYRCGQQLAVSAAPAESLLTEIALWRKFIGPRADYYLERFRLFRQGGHERFVPTWHWPAFLVGWLWYLYRKMYLHAAVFLFGGLLPMVLGAGLVGVLIWNVFAAVAANYLYCMHIKLSLALIERRAGSDETARDHLIEDSGGIQPYVWWLGIGLTAVAIGAGIMEALSSIKPPSSGAPPSALAPNGGLWDSEPVSRLSLAAVLQYRHITLCPLRSIRFTLSQSCGRNR